MYRRLITIVALLAAATPVAAQQRDSAAFVVRLGTDTLSVERYVRTADRIVMEAVHRSPSTTRHRLELSLAANGAVTEALWFSRRLDSGDTLVRRTIRFDRDTAMVVTVQGTSSRELRVAARDAGVVAGPFYAPYEMLIMRAIADGGPRVELPLLTGPSVARIPIERLGADSVLLQDQFGQAMRAHIDGRGRLLHMRTPSHTTIERVRWVDLDAMARDFSARDASGRGMGEVSPRRTYRVSVGGANIWVDYSRPAMRGRPIWGGIVPLGEVWRMGANDAAHLATDRTISVGDLTLQPGTYTLFLLPTDGTWTLIVNRGTGMSGLARDSTLDVGRVPMQVETTARAAEQFTIGFVPGPAGGTLSVAWDRTRGSVPVTVR